MVRKPASRFQDRPSLSAESVELAVIVAVNLLRLRRDGPPNTRFTRDAGDSTDHRGAGGSSLCVD